MRIPLLWTATLCVAGFARAQLWVGLEDASLALKSSDLAGFPVVSWTNHPAFEVNGMAAAPDGSLFICNGPFTTRIHRYNPATGATQLLCTSAVDLHGLGYGHDTLYGFANFASPMGIYSIDLESGAATLVVNTSASGRRFFGLDFNPADGLLYGYDEYGSPGGLCSIDPESGEILSLAGPIPAENSQGRALAVGNGVVYVAATRGDDGIACYAWDLEAGGPWTAFTQPYPTYHNTGGAAFLGGEEPPRCEVEPASLELGVLLVGGSRSGSFTVTNTGGGILDGAATTSCDGVQLDDNSWSLAPGQSQIVGVQITAEMPGTWACDLDLGADCDPLPVTAHVVGAEIFHGEDSACGLVETLGHLPGAFSGFLVDWNSGDVGIQLANGLGHQLAAGIWVNGQHIWSGPIDTDRWEAAETGYHPSAPGEDVTLFLTVSDGVDTWNAGGSICSWDLRFAGLADEDRPQDFRLGDPAPNPFNPATTISVELARAGEQELRVLDLAGRTVAVLQRGSLSAGEHTFRWEPSGQAGGLYFLQATHAGGNETRRLLYLP